MSHWGRRGRFVALAIGAPLVGCGGSTSGGADAPVISNLTLSVEGGDGGAVWGRVDAVDPGGLDSPTLDLVLSTGATSIYQDAANVASAQGDTTAVVSFLLEVPANDLPSGMWTAQVTLIAGGTASNTLVGAVP